MNALRRFPSALVPVLLCAAACGGAPPASSVPAKAPPPLVTADAPSSAPPIAASDAGTAEGRLASSVEAPPAEGVTPASDPPGAAAASSATAEAPSSPPSATEPPPSPPRLPAGTTVLHVGDSFAGALGLPLNKRLREAGIRGVLQFETASYIPGWAAGDKLRGYLNRYSPDLVLVTLGANELEIVQPEQRIRNIRKLIDTIGKRPCVWIATPLWDGAKNGLMEIIRQNAAPCLYMDTNALIPSMPRVSDGIHPTLSAREDWANVVMSWLEAHHEPTSDRPWALAEQPRALAPNVASSGHESDPR